MSHDLTLSRDDRRASTRGAPPVSGRADWDTDGRDWPNRRASRFVDAGGLRWHVQVEGEGPVLLLLHGTAAATHSWRAVLSPLAQHLQVIAPDLPGHGFTSLPRSYAMTSSAMAASLGELLRSLAVSPEMIVGHSAGAAIAVRMAISRIAHPKAIVAINGALTPFEGLSAQIFPALARLFVLNPFVPHIVAWSASDRGRVKRLIENTGSRIDAAGLDAYAMLLATRQHANAALRMMANWDLDAVSRDLPSLDCPLLLIAGRRDRAVPPEEATRLAARLQSRAAKTSVTIMDGGHLVHEETPDAVVEAIVSYAAANGVGAAS